jgi:uncharacterized protein YaiL (DUF2058 family)
MGNSLGDQLLKTGLVDEKRVRQAKKARQKQRKQQQHSKTTRVDEAGLLAQQTQREKAEHDRERSRVQREEEQRREIAAQIEQLVETNRQSKGEGDVPFNFADGTRIARVFVSKDLRKRLANGRAAIVKWNGHYEIVPSGVAERIRIRDEKCLILCNEGDQPDEREDPYADHPVPDDLVW